MHDTVDCARACDDAFPRGRIDEIGRDHLMSLARKRRARLGEPGFIAPRHANPGAASGARSGDRATQSRRPARDEQSFACERIGVCAHTSTSSGITIPSERTMQLPHESPMPNPDIKIVAGAEVRRSRRQAVMVRGTDAELVLPKS